jgi:Fe-S oxidoreductase
MRDVTLQGEVIFCPQDVLWSCTTCATCGLRCPKDIDPYEFLIDIRGLEVEKGRIAPTLRDALETVFKHGNPWGRIRSKRSEWTNDLKVENVSKGTEILYYVGCTASYDPRVQEVARSLVKSFDEAGVDFGVLGDEENCCGSEVYGMGEKGLFELLVEENKELFKKYDVKRIVTNCPHAFHTFKNRYSLKVEVQHYTQLLSGLIENGRLSFSRRVDGRVIYHDPCFLGKQNGVYEEPRKIIERIPGVELIEFDRSRSRSVCCEGGGGRMWIDVPGERLAEARVKEAVNSGSDIMAVACPFCLLTFEDAVKTSGYEDEIRVVELAELVSMAL